MTVPENNPPREQISLKMSHETTLEEFQAQLRTTPGNENVIVTPSDFAKLKARMNAQAVIETAVKQIIDPLLPQLDGLSERQKADKKLELRYLALYLVRSKSSIKVLEVRESPDFIVDQSGKRIGVELTRLVDSAVIAEANAFQRMLFAAQQRLMARYGQAKQLYRFDVDLSAIIINDGDRVIDDLVHLVESLLNGSAYTLPSYCHGVYSHSHDTLSLTLTERYLVQPLASSNLLTLIEEKEARLPKYRLNAQSDDIILLMVMEGAGSKSNYDISAFSLPAIQTGFKKIVLLDEFDLSIHMLYP